jgi:hypothetical protein
MKLAAKVLVAIAVGVLSSSHALAQEPFVTIDRFSRTPPR